MVSAFGPARILYSTSRSPAGHTAVDGDSRPARVHVSLEDLLRHSDAVVLTCSLSDKTRHLIRAETLGLMPRGAMLINTARGGCVKQDDVLEALNSGHLAGVGLDVTDPEPLAPDHPLVLHPRCLVLPHVGSATVAAREAMARLAIDNAIAGLLGLDMPAELKF
ncbi:hypothetical protein HK405_012190 [Cladochytrium tenue]|nr:hypothetical protein HK405_012190 [Cladochytrium tenue]